MVVHPAFEARPAAQPVQLPGAVAAILDRRLLTAADGSGQGGGYTDGGLPGPAVDQQPVRQPECRPDDPVAEQWDDRFTVGGLER